MGPQQRFIVSRYGLYTIDPYEIQPTYLFCCSGDSVIDLPSSFLTYRSGVPHYPGSFLVVSYSCFILTFLTVFSTVVVMSSTYFYWWGLMLLLTLLFASVYSTRALTSSAFLQLFLTVVLCSSCFSSCSGYQLRSTLYSGSPCIPVPPGMLKLVLLHSLFGLVFIVVSSSLSRSCKAWNRLLRAILNSPRFL